MILARLYIFDGLTRWTVFVHLVSYNVIVDIYSTPALSCRAGESISHRRDKIDESELEGQSEKRCN